MPFAMPPLCTKYPGIPEQAICAQKQTALKISPYLRICRHSCRMGAGFLPVKRAVMNSRPDKTAGTDKASEGMLSANGHADKEDKITA